VNKYIAERTFKEYYEDNKDKIQEYMKEYKKEYSIKNKDKIKEYKKEYDEKKKEKKSEQGKVKITCVCGSCYRKADKSKHERTKERQSFLKTIE
jgi:hypothetical protein